MSKFRKNLTFEIQARHQSVSGSCMICSIYFPDGEKFKFIVDAGIFQEEEYDFLNHVSDFKPSKIDNIFITHSHIDHVGALPIFVKNGFNGNIYMTENTRNIVPLTLFDSAKIFAKDLEIKHISALYSSKDVVKALQHVIGCEFGKTIEINKNIKVTFFENGHLYGSALILFEANYKNETLNILFTGDYASKNYFFTPKRLPSRVKKLENLVIVQESTYGDTSAYDVKKKFDIEFSKLIGAGKSVLIPSLALERYEIVLAHLKKLQESGKLDINIPIYLDGKLALNYLKKFTKFYGFDFLPANISIVDPNSRYSIINSDMQKIIVTTSGMCTNGPAVEYLPEIIHRSNWAVFFTSYLSPSSIAHKIATCYASCYTKNKKSDDTSRKIKLWDTEYDLNATICHTLEFSSHAKKEHLIKFLKQFENVLAVFVNHGEASVKSAYSEKLKELGYDNVCILSREVYFTLDKTGVLSQSTTKFKMENPKVKKLNPLNFKKKLEKKRICKRDRHKRVNYYRDLKAQKKMLLRQQNAS